MEHELAAAPLAQSEGVAAGAAKTEVGDRLAERFQRFLITLLSNVL
jgi:hypothetical protein